MRETNWQTLDKDQIIDLIIKHNAGLEPLKGEQERRVRGKLENMNAVELWKHIADVYGGILYEPDSVLADPLELKRREMEQARAERDRLARIKKASKSYHIDRPRVIEHYDMKHDAHTYFYGKDYVLNVFEVAEGLIVLTSKPKKCARLKETLYPTLNIVFLKPEGK